MSEKKPTKPKAAKPSVALQPVKVEQAAIAAPTQAAKAPKTGTARLLNKTTGQVVTVARKVADSLSSKYPKQYQTLS